MKKNDADNENIMSETPEEKAEERNKGWKICSLLLLALPFALLELGIRFIGRRVNYFRAEMIAPAILFFIVWTALFVLLPLCFSKNAGRIIYAFFFIVCFLFFLTNGVYYPYTGYFFNFNLLLMAGEGSSYIIDTMLGASPVLYLYCILLIAVFVIVLKSRITGRCFAEGFDKKRFLIVLLSFVVLHLLIPFTMGKGNSGLEWDTWRRPRNVYNNFNDANKNMKICGLFEYTVRDFYVTFLKPEESANSEEKAFLDEAYAAETIHAKNEMTGLFEGKNVIFLQLEGIDSWLLDEETMPNLYSLMQEGMNFSEHYSFYNGGGSTFNSELCVNTGFVTPISYIRNAYTFSSNLFPYSMPKMFKERGYTVNAFHMNTAEYYSRGINYKNWGYDNYYSLLDENDYDKNDLSYELDRELIENESFYERIFKTDGPFVDYIITFTPHTPFSSEKGLGKYLLEKNGIETDEPMSEEEVARLFAGETDYFVGLLVQGLKDNGLYENTVIIAYADHYLYTLEDKSILAKNKAKNPAGLDTFSGTESSPVFNNLINNTPFIIWSADLADQGLSGNNNTVNSQLDILPTALNLFEISYTEENYIGQDILDENAVHCVFFPDYAYYVDGQYDEEQAPVYIHRKIKINDLTLKYDYFRMKQDQN